MQRWRAGSEFVFPVAARTHLAYLALPPAGRGPGVLVLHESEGLDEFARDVSDRLAREGFVALAPDWLGTPREVLEAAVAVLLGRDACEGPRVGAIGFGPGGAHALALGRRGGRVGAVAACWSEAGSLEPEIGALEAACLALFAERDARAPAAAVRAFESRLEAAGRRSAVRMLAGVSPGFLDSGRHAVFDAAAASEAWDLVLGFLRTELA
jgi:carboxymethylenebutenolidase